MVYAGLRTTMMFFNIIVENIFSSSSLQKFQTNIKAFTNTITEVLMFFHCDSGGKMEFTYVGPSLVFDRTVVLKALLHENTL